MIRPLLLLLAACSTPDCPEGILIGETCALTDPSCPEGFLLEGTCVDSKGDPIVDEPPPVFEGDAEAFADLFYQLLCQAHAACIDERHDEDMVCISNDDTPQIRPGCTVDADKAKECIAEMYEVPCGYPTLLWPPACRTAWTGCDDPFPDAEDLQDSVFRERGHTPEDRWYTSLGANWAIEEPGNRDQVELTLFAGNTYHLHTTVTPTADPANTVLRLFGPDGSLVHEGENQPLRAGGLAAALVYSAPKTGRYVLEVLDYSDWDRETEGLTPYGAPELTYDLYGTRLKNTELSPNTTVADVRAALQDDAWAVHYARLWSSSSYSDLHGTLSSPGEIDTWPLEIVTSSPVVEQAFSIWRDGGSDAQVRLSVLDDEGSQIASSEELGSGRVGWRLDEAIVTRVANGDALFLQVQAADGQSIGPYTLRGVPRLPSEPEVEPNDDDTTATPLTLDAAETVRAWGYLEPGEVDVFEILSPNIVERHLTIQTRAQGVGSGAKLKATLTNGVGTVLSPLRRGLGIEGDPGDSFVFLRQATRLFVRIETAEDSEAGEYYFVAQLHD